ncbi:expressed unknown protein [Seminavis robusta]|uniref:Uncharacterized protein n=1 Tax=Seminavis robusta TaxID=568900 RepID=A0A9N8HRJ7_9STRA|nr:expressed unknown protein [Seminavis robusta]|eukprot:Sro1580_g283770.1 n/a (366) ;mRNA; f:15701-16900
MKIILAAAGFLVASVAGDGIRGGVSDEISVWGDHGGKKGVGVIDHGTHGAEEEDGGEDDVVFAVPWDDDIDFDEEKYLSAGDNALPWVVDGVGFSSVDEYLEYAHGRRVTDHPYFRRMLDENGDPVAPSNKDFTELLVAELEYQRAVNGTVDSLEAMASVAQQIVFKAIEADETGDNRTEWIMEHLTISEQGTPEALEMAKIIAENANHTACEIPGECVTQARLKIVKNWIEDYLNNCIQTGTELDLDYMYQRLFAETDVDPQSADELIQSSPAIRDQIDYMIQEADIAARENELAPRAELVEKALIDAGNNMTDFEDALEEIGFSEEEVSVLLRSLAPERLAKVEEAIRKPKEDYEAQVLNLHF